MGKVISTLLFQPPDEASHLSSKKYFWLNTSHGAKIPAFHITQPHAKFTILYSHGNAEDLGMIYEYLAELSELLYINIFAYDYSGYGLGKRRKDNIENNIEPSEENCYSDIEAAYEYLTQVELVSSRQIVVYGRSVGSGPSCYLAQKLANGDGHPVAGLILHSPFLSVCRVVIDMGLEMTLDIFPNVSRIKDVGCPTFIMHGTNDEVVPFRHGKGLYEALPEDLRYPPFWAENMGHNNIELDMTSVFIKKLQRFFLHLLKTQGSQKKLNQENVKRGIITGLEQNIGVTFSHNELDEPVIVSDSEDEIEKIRSTESLKKKGSKLSRKSSKLSRKMSLPTAKDYASFSDPDDDDDEEEDRSPSEKLKSAVPFYRTVAPVSREEVECLAESLSNNCL